MADQKMFDRNSIKKKAFSETSGILDQLSLPPALITFLQKNQKTIWAIVICITVVVTVVSLYASYRDYTHNKAASALDAAMMADTEQKIQQLQQVVDQYGSTPAAVWSRVELAHDAAKQGDTGRAIEELKTINATLSAKDALKPLVLINLAGLYEKDNQLDQAVQLYQELSLLKGFELEGFYALGRVYEREQKTEQAVDAYQKYLAATETTTVNLQADPVRQMVQSRLHRLRQ